MRTLILVASFLSLTCQWASAEETDQPIRAMILSTVAFETNRRVSTESLTIQSLSAGQIAWQLCTDSRVGGEVNFSEAEFLRFVQTLQRELDAHIAEHQDQSTRYLFTFLGRDRVEKSVLVDESFFEKLLPSSVIAKSILDDVMRKKQMKNFYVHSYITTAYPFKNAAIGWVYGKSNGTSNGTTSNGTGVESTELDGRD